LLPAHFFCLVDPFPSPKKTRAMKAMCLMFVGGLVFGLTKVWVGTGWDGPRGWVERSHYMRTLSFVFASPMVAFYTDCDFYLFFGGKDWEISRDGVVYISPLLC